MRLNDVGQAPLPIQPVENPILCSPYAEPTEYWEYDRATGQAARQSGRRPARYWYKTRAEDRAAAVRQGTLTLELDEGQDELPIVNALRDDIRRWRDSGYEGATTITKELLRCWTREDRPRRLFFCQIEAVETVIYLTEIRGALPGGGRRRPRFTPKLEEADFAKLMDLPDGIGRPLPRYGCKMATGSGKTVVMAMLIAWAFCNRGQVPSDERFPRAALICCPNLTVRERLQVLRPEEPGNYYAAFDMVPPRLRPLLGTGKVLVTNWHAFKPESEHAEGGKTYAVVNKGAEDDESYARRILGDLYAGAVGGGGLMVLNDEAHHAYRPKPLAHTEELTAEQRAEREEATVWITGIDRFNRSVGVRFCVDLSATPFYLKGSGYAEGEPFSWLVSDFGLVDAIESGIVKIPRLPVGDTTGRPDPFYFRLWESIVGTQSQPGRLHPGDFVGGSRRRKPRPESIWREASPALATLMSQWVQRFELLQNAENSAAERTPPCLILVCDNTEIAEYFYEQISGEQIVETLPDEVDDISEDEDTDADAPVRPARGRAVRKKISYGEGKLFSEYFANRPGRRNTLRVDSRVLALADSGEEGGSREDAAQELRRIVATVGKPGEPGEQIRCVVSVAMLTEGWDANNVTHIFGLRAFQSQLLCEQVVGRGLRRMDYTVDPKTGRLTEEYVDVYGIPFSVIPYKGRATDAPAPEDKPKNHVKAMPERAAFEIRFPNVEGYAFALQKNMIRANVSAMEPLELQPNLQPTSVYVRPSVGYGEGHAGLSGPGEFEFHDRTEFYANFHLQTIKFDMARQVVHYLVGDTRTSPKPSSKIKDRLIARHLLFPQVLRIVSEYVDTKVEAHGVDKRELALEVYFRRALDRLVNAIEPDEDSGESPLMPILNRYTPFGSSKDVAFTTVKQVRDTIRSHISHVVLDTMTWESSAAFYLEQSKYVLCYARNEQMGFSIPYEYDGKNHVYEPDFLVRLKDNRTLILEIKGMKTDQENAKHQAARRWVSAVNNAEKMGRWVFHVCEDPHTLDNELGYILAK